MIIKNVYQETNFFTKDECNKILNFSNIYKAEKTIRQLEPNINFETNRIEQIVETDLNGKVRGKLFYVWDIWNDSNSKWMYDKLVNWFTETTKIKLTDTIRKNCSLHKYVKGDLFMRHIDLNEKFSERRWNVGIQLSEDYIGGDYILYENNKKFIFSKNVGTIVAYKADIEHEITEIKEGERWSIVYSIPKQMISKNNSNFI